MTEERFQLSYETNKQYCIWWAVRDGGITLWKEEVVYLMNQLNDENIKLKEEIQMLKITISRNEQYIDRLTHKGEWGTRVHENSGLKVKEDDNEHYEELQRLKEEHEQLKSEILKIKELVESQEDSAKEKIDVGKNYWQCEYYTDNDLMSGMGYCSNPERHNKVNCISLLYCLGDECEYDTKKKWW